MRKAQNRESQMNTLRLSDFRSEVSMKKLFPLFLLVLTFSTDTFSQDNQTENRPQAYRVGSSKRAEKTLPQVYIVREISDTQPQVYQVVGSRSELTRPRVYGNEQTKPLKVVNTFDLERRAFELINERRENCGLSPLKWSDDIARIARLHSENMANYNFFSHTGIDGLMVNDRADFLGIRKWQAIGENIAFNQGFENPVEFAVEHWMKSPKHRDNLMNSRWKESGIGVAVTENGKYYFTEVFIVRK
jgi:uncharacterized protein YkwD